VLSLKQHVAMFTAAEATVMLGRAMALGIDLRPVYQQIVDLTGLHPYLLERLCYSIVDHFQDTAVVDVDRAYRDATGTFRDYFQRLADVIEADLGQGGIALLRSLAGGAAPSWEDSRELDLFSDFGVITSSAGYPALFAGSFARHLLAV